MPSDMQVTYDSKYNGGFEPVPPAQASTASGLPADFKIGDNAFVGTDGLIHYYTLNGDELLFQQGQDGSYSMYIPPPKGSAGGGADNTVGMANVGLGYAELGENSRQFDASMAQRQAESAQQNSQFQQDFTEGQRQFDLQYGRSAYESDREYEQAKSEFAQTFAESQRQFDMQYGLDSRRVDQGDRRLDLDAELGRGELQLGRDRLGLDTELGRGALQNDTARVGIERDRLGLDTELGRGRLALDTRLGEGGLRLNAADLAFRQRSTDRSQRLDESKFRAEVLRNPSDYVYRAFESRGQQSPTARINHADILNSLQTYAFGGTGDAPLFLTGGGGPELVANHGDGTFSVASAPQTQRILGRLPGGLEALMRERWAGMQQQMGAGVRSRMMGAGATNVNPAAVEPAQPMMNRTFAPGPGMTRPAYQGRLDIQPAAVQGYASGTDDAFFRELDQISSYTPTPAPTFTQDELVGAARTYSPPAVSAALAGQDAGAYRPVSSGLTLRRMSRLAPGELAALNTRLGVEYNTTLADETAGLQSRFGPVRDRAQARMAV